MDFLGVTRIAREDITNYIRSKYSNLGIEYNGEDYDSWVCGWSHLYTKENIRLNRVLGLHKINKQWVQREKNF